MGPMTRFTWTVFFAATVSAVGAGTIALLPSGKTYAHEGAPETHQGAHSSAAAPAADVEIVVREGGLPVLKGQQAHGRVLALVAGEPIVIALRNEDTGPREFISPLFTRAEIHFAGRAVGIFRKEAAGFRLNPGDTLTLHFIAPYSGFQRMYDLIWCGHDGKPGTETQELVIVVTEQK